MRQRQVVSLIERHEGWVNALSYEEHRDLAVRLSMGLMLRGVTMEQCQLGWTVINHTESWSVLVPTTDLAVAEWVAWELLIA